jgi:AraC-like DNA-binding protein
VDILSDAVAATRTGRPRWGLVRHAAPWAREFAPAPGTAAVHVVLSGTCVLRPAGRGAAEAAATARAGPGDVLVVPHGAGYALGDVLRAGGQDAAGERPRAHVPAPATPYADEPGPAPGGEVTALLSGGYRYDPRHVHPLLAELPPVLHLPAAPARHPEVAAAVRLLAGELERPRLGTDVLVPPLLDALLPYVLRAWYADRARRAEQAAGPGGADRHGGAVDRTGGWAAALADPPVAAALRAMHRSPAAPWTVERLAREAGLSRAAFARRFAALTGRPPLAYLTWWRMTLAARLLADSALPLAAVASRVGYTSEFAFAHAFKRWRGQAPGRYRRAQAELPPPRTAAD